MAALNRKDRDRLLRKADILKAAEHIFALKGYDKATIQDIAKQAQYATGTVYLYFRDKGALYCSLLEEKMKDLLAGIKEKTSLVKDAQAKLEIFLEEELGFFKINQDFFRIFVSENNGLRFTIGFRISKSSVFREYSECVSNLVKKAQQQGLIRGDLYPAQIIDIFRSIFTSVIIGWLRKELREPKDPKEMSRFILDIFLNGIGCKK
jgi:TetR/AcrR family fatty acid metabolism transcriptional regulator